MLVEAVEVVEEDERMTLLYKRFKIEFSKNARMWVGYQLSRVKQIRLIIQVMQTLHQFRVEGNMHWMV